MNLHEVLAKAMAVKASDIHLVVNAPLFYRVGGELLPDGDPLTPEDTRAFLEALLTPERQTLFETHGYLSYGYGVPELGYFRVTLFRERGHFGAAIRVIPSQLETMESLGLPPLIEEWACKANGLVLVTGATGVGKTTTLNVMIDLINNSRRVKIVTIEDPIEYIHSHKRSVVVQKEVRVDTPSYAEALIQVLREDPQVIVIGEMRDRETIATALTAAETGHLVMGTLHTRTAISTVQRIRDVFPATQQDQVVSQLSNSLVGIISQNLLHRVDNQGRILAYETLVATPAVRSMIREGDLNGIATAITTGGRYGMRTLDDCLRELYEKAIITYDDAVAHAVDAKSLLERIERNK